MIDLNDYFYFVHVVEKRGFSAAARVLNMPKSRLSRHISQLESRLGVRLLQRSSRNVSVTDIGQAFYVKARDCINAMELAEASIQQNLEAVSGRVTLSCSVGVAHFLMTDLVSEFLSLHPQVCISQQVSNDAVDLIASGIDIAIRGHSYNLPDSSLVQSPLAKVVWHLYASPEFIAQHGQPETPYDLGKYDFLTVGWRNNTPEQPLEHSNGIKTRIKVRSKLCSDDMATLRHAAIQGLGVVALPSYTCVDSVTAGQLKRIMPDWLAGSARLSMLMPTRLGVAPQIAALADFIRANLAQKVNVP